MVLLELSEVKLVQGMLLNNFHRIQIKDNDDIWIHHSNLSYHRSWLVQTGKGNSAKATLLCKTSSGLIDKKKTQKMDFLKIAHKMAADCQEVLLQKQQDMLY